VVIIINKKRMIRRRMLLQMSQPLLDPYLSLPHDVSYWERQNEKKGRKKKRIEWY
jgi:hypothetical protein